MLSGVARGLIGKNKLWRESRFLIKDTKLQYLCVLLMLISAFLGIITPRFEDKIETLTVLSGGILFLIYGRNLRWSPLIVLLIGVIVVQILTWLSIHFSYPEYPGHSLRINRLSVWFILLPIAFILGGQLRNVFILWGVAAVGLLLSPWLVGGGWEEIQAGLNGKRIDFGIHNAQHSAMLFGTLLLGCIFFSNRCLTKLFTSAWWTSLIWLLCLMSSIIAVAITQTRAVWLALVIAFIVAVIGVIFYYLYRVTNKSKLILFKDNQKKVFALLSIWITIGLAGVYFTASVYKTRLSSDIVNFKKSDELTDERNYEISAGIRIASWKHGLQWARERPLLGWGWEGRTLVIRDAPGVPENFKKHAGHLHSTYMDTLVNYGVMGLGILLMLFAYLFFSSILAWGKAYIPLDMLLFFSTFLIYWSIVNLFESYMFFASGEYVFSLIGGGVLTLIWRGVVERKEAAASITEKENINVECI